MDGYEVRAIIDPRERERLRWLNNHRLAWHESLLGDPEMHKGGAALAFAGLVLHRYDVRRGYAEISASYASVRLNMSLSSVHRGRRICLRQCWIAEWQPVRPPKRRLPDLARRYTLAGGPNDLLLDELVSAAADTPAADDTPP